MGEVKPYQPITAADLERNIEESTKELETAKDESSKAYSVYQAARNKADKLEERIKALKAALEIFYKAKLD